jgi:hypothetical protein
MFFRHNVSSTPKIYLALLQSAMQIMDKLITVMDNSHALKPVPVLPQVLLIKLKKKKQGIDLNLFYQNNDRWTIGRKYHFFLVLLVESIRKVLENMKGVLDEI